MTLYDTIARLPLDLDGYALENHGIETAAGWTRLTTVIRMRGGGRQGRGEEVNYSERDQTHFREGGAVQPITGVRSFAELSARLDELDLGPLSPEFPGQDIYRRWAFESAGLDLALSQAGENLFSLLGVEPQPVRFVASLSISGQSDMPRVRAMLAAHPGLELKLDAVPAWSDAMIAELAATGSVRIVDFKGAYEGTPVDTAPDLALYRRVIDGLPPDVLFEDPHRIPQVLSLFESCRDRVTWDAPIHGVDDIDSLPWPPAVLNFKPSRFGSAQRLFEAYATCQERGIEIYGGGQFELGAGRGQIQLLASLFHADAPNDVSPVEYHADAEVASLPTSPIPAPGNAPGFQWNKSG